VKLWTPAKIKADLVFVASLIAVFGFKLPDSISVALIASAGLIAAGLNLGDALLEKYAPQFLPSVLGEVKTLESDVEKGLPLILPVLEQLPGKIGEEVKQAIEAIEKGPVAQVTKAPETKTETNS
jgi:hypothetical protein